MWGKGKHWLKVKTFEEAEFDLIRVRRERGKPAMAPLARNGRPGGSAFITLPAGIRERLWERVLACIQKAARKAPAPTGVVKAPVGEKHPPVL